MSSVSSESTTTATPSGSGTGRNRLNSEVVSTRLGSPITVPSGSAVTALLRCSAWATGTATTVAAGHQDGAELPDALGVRARRRAHVHDATHLQHVAAVERAVP